ncbi:TPA: transcriptional regulator [Candidatus Gastranaerophilales bacterium HUM_10]|nr:MAG TPA: transcriptional regulator [Candidatus Gastranaerophilales bacterium HUM_10]
MANSTAKNIRKNIVLYRKKSGLTQAALSELSDISTDYLSEIERGKKIPRWDKLDAIADALEIETYKLVMKPESS